MLGETPKLVASFSASDMSLPLGSVPLAGRRREASRGGGGGGG